MIDATVYWASACACQCLLPAVVYLQTRKWVAAFAAWWFLTLVQAFAAVVAGPWPAYPIWASIGVLSPIFALAGWSYWPHGKGS